MIMISAVFALKDFRAAVWGASRVDGPGETLRLLEPIEREIGRNETHQYAVRLESNQFLRIELMQFGVDLVIQLHAQTGEKLATIDSLSGPNGKETLVYAAQQAGEYQIRVTLGQDVELPGKYRLLTTELRAVTARDEHLLIGQRLYNQGLEAIFGSKAEVKRQALEKFQVAAAHWLAADEQELYLHALPLIGLGNMSLGDLTSAELAYRVGAEKARAINSLPWEATSLRGLGDVKYKAGLLREAIDVYTEYLTLNQSLGDAKTEAQVLGRIAKIHEYLGDTPQALRVYEQALPLARRNRLARIEAATLSKMGEALFRLGEYQEAIGCFNDSLPISRRVKDHRSEAETLNALGRVYAALEERQEAMDFFNRGLDEAKTVRDSELTVQAMSNIGRLKVQLGQIDEGEGDLLNALKLCNERSIRLEMAPILSNLGEAFVARGDLETADKRFREALEISRKIGDRQREMASLSQLGRLFRKQGRMKEAGDRLRDALVISREIRDRRSEAQTLYEIADLLNETRDFEQARARIDEAIRIIETLRTNFASREMRASYLATVQNFYYLQIDTLMSLSRKQGDRPMIDALSTSETARARSLLEIMHEPGGASDRLSPELRQRRARLERESLSKNIRLVELQSSKNDKTDSKSIELLSAELSAIENELHAIEASIYESDPAYRRLAQPRPLRLEEIQREVLDENTLLLEYALGEKQGYLWVVGRESLSAYPVPRRGEIEEDVRRLLGLLTQRPSKTPAERLNASREYARLATELSRKLLGPVAGRLNGQRLLIVGDGALNSLPFGALAAPATENGLFLPLLARHEIVGLPSATTLAFLRREAVGRKLPSRQLAVFADPVFGAYDPRITIGHAASEARSRTPNATERGISFLHEILSSSDAAPAAGDDKAPPTTEANDKASAALGDRSKRLISRLIHSRDEADAIFKLADPQTTLRALDFQAKRELAISDEMKNYRILHFATHGFINDLRPNFSGLIFSTINEQGEPIEGFLPATEIANLRLNPDLVVLSSCQSAIGKQLLGEGFRGLTRSFLLAGAPRIVASLWKVNDAATASLMKRFYQHMLGPRKLSPAAALRLAQLEMSKDPRWSAPYFWAAFVLQGEIN